MRTYRRPTCMQCGKGFKPADNRQVYCSKACGDKYRNHLKREDHRKDTKNNVVDVKRTCTVEGCKRPVKWGNRFLCATHFFGADELAEVR